MRCEYKEVDQQGGTDLNESIKQAIPAIWNPDRCEEGVFCPICDVWIDDYEGQPEKCPNCGVPLDGWIDGRKEV